MLVTDNFPIRIVRCTLMVNAGSFWSILYDISRPISVGHIEGMHVLSKYCLINMLPVDVLCTTQFEDGVGALQEYVDTNFLKPNGQCRNLNVYGVYCNVFCTYMHRCVLWRLAICMT